MDAIDAVPMEDVYKKLGASDRFIAMIEMQHMLHNNLILDPGFKSTYVTDPITFKGHWEDLHPEEFESTARQDFEASGRQSKFWRNMSAADDIGFYAELNNPDNKWEWGVLHHHETRIPELVKYFTHNIQTQYAALSEESQRELAGTLITGVPETAVDFQEYLRTIGEGPLSVGAKQYRISQAQLQFILKQGARYFKEQYRGSGEVYIPWFSEVVDPKLWDQYKHYLKSYANMHPTEAIKEMKQTQYLSMYGDAPSQAKGYRADLFGIQTVPQLPIFKPLQVSHLIQSNSEIPGTMQQRAFMQAHNVHLGHMRADAPTVQYHPGAGLGPLISTQQAIAQPWVDVPRDFAVPDGSVWDGYRQEFVKEQVTEGDK